MSELKLCRICLNKDVKLFKLEQCNLKHYYEQIIHSKVLSIDELPRYFCFECAALLHKYHKFKEKCDFGQSTLKTLACRGFMTPHLIEDIRKNRSDLQPPSDYINYICAKRIKTLNIKYKADIEPLEMENVIINSFPVDEAFKYEYIPESNHEESDNYSDVDIILKCEKGNELSETKVTTNVEPVFKNTADPEITTFDPKNLDPKSDPDIEKTRFDSKPTPKIEKTMSKIENNVLRSFLLNLDKDDSSNSFSFGMDVEVDKDTDENGESDKKKTNKTTKKTAKKKEDKEEVKVTDPDESHKFMGIIREPKGELSKGNWETKLLTEDEAMEQFKKREFDNKYERMEFKCIKCFKGFSQNEMLQRHDKLWHDKGDHECRFCHMQFKWKSQLQVHMMKHYYIYKCLRCDLQFYLKNGAVFHDGHHNGVIHKCKHCGEEYTHISTYYTHLRTSHRNTHACKLCGATFVSQTGVVVHMKRKHVMPISEELSTNIYCQKCDISFVSQSAFDEHLAQSKNHEDEANKTGIKRTRRRRREILANAARCIHCNKKFKSKTEVKIHIAEEHPGRSKVERVVCEICGAVLSSAYIEIHMNRHTRKKVYPCQTCGKEFLCVTSHNTHQLTHSGEKPHACPICPKRFGLKGHMEVHYKRVHLKEPYPKSVQKPKLTDCPVCHKTFQSRSHMDTHLRRVHLKEPYPKSGPKLCPICSKPFAYASDMDVHYRRVHLKEPYPKRTYNRKNRNRQPQELPLYASLPK